MGNPMGTCGHLSFHFSSDLKNLAQGILSPTSRRVLLVEGFFSFSDGLVDEMKLLPLHLLVLAWVVLEPIKSLEVLSICNVVGLKYITSLNGVLLPLPYALWRRGVSRCLYSSG